MTKQEYYNSQNNDLKQRMSQQDSAFRNKMIGSNISVRSTWQKDIKSTIFHITTSSLSNKLLNTCSNVFLSYT